MIDKPNEPPSSCPGLRLVSRRLLTSVGLRDRLLRGTPQLTTEGAAKNAHDPSASPPPKPSSTPEGEIPPDDMNLVHRAHRRPLMAPVGSSLLTFKSHKELLAGLIQGLEIHERLVQDKGILHRDISPNNMVFEPGTDAIRRLMITDFDHVVPSKESIQHRYGTDSTLQFISLALLRKVPRYGGLEKPQVQHEVSDDLESFFYVFLWICIFSNGPDVGAGQTRPQSDPSSILHLWGTKESLDYCRWSNICHAKDDFMYTPDKTIDKEFTPYFSIFKGLAKQWKQLVKREDLRRSQPDHKEETPLTHQTIIQMLRNFADILPGPDIPRFPASLPPPNSSAPVSRKRPRSSSSAVDTGAKLRRINSTGSINTGWLPVRHG